MHETVHTVVFSAGEGGGNPCPVTLFADELTPAEMQEAARRFGQESVFLCRPSGPAYDFRPRYFMPLREVEMCLHATIGSVTVLAERGLIRRSPVIYETGYGPMRIEWERSADGTVEVAVEQFAPQFKSSVPSTEELCRALRIAETDLAELPVESAATSRFKLIVPLKERAVLDALDPDFEYLWELCDRYETTGFCPFTRETEPDGSPVFCMRQFPNKAGYPEDPATGVAASALGAYLVRHEVLPVHEGKNSFSIRQGEAMGRPSRIGADVFVENGETVRTRVRGSAVIVS